MSQIQLNAFFDFCRVKVVKQSFDKEKQMVTIAIHPDERFDPVGHCCQQRVKRIHSYYERMVRDLNCIDAQTYLLVIYRTVRCPRCGNKVEGLDVVEPEKRVTKRLENSILSLCSSMTIKEIAEHLEIDWKTVKAIHKKYLKAKLSRRMDENPRLLAVDEISVKKRHRYLTVILNWETGRIVWVGKERKYETLKEYFDSLSEEQKGSIEAIAMDTWDPSIKAVKECCPEASIVFREFHMVKAFGRVIDQVRRQEYHQATSEGKEAIKGSKYLLLKNIITECQAPLSYKLYLKSGRHQLELLIGFTRNTHEGEPAFRGRGYATSFLNSSSQWLANTANIPGP